jgi:large subunit ribosomal protein L3
MQAEDTLPAIGDIVAVENVFKPGDIVKVSGVSKGKGFAGVVKRHHFRGGPRTHGQSDRERAPGSIGQTTTPGRVYRGKKMAGRMGHEKVSVTHMQIVGFDLNSSKKNLLVKGLMPGSANSIVKIEKTGELAEKKFVALLKVEEPKEAKETKET